jgi:putative cardiolipin synthase
LPDSALRIAIHDIQDGRMSVRRKSDTAFRASLATILAVVLLAGCATAPPGADYPKTFSTAFTTPEATQLGKQIAVQADKHPDLSGFQIIPRGLDGLLMRTQLVRAAEQSLDIQYFIFVEDYTGKLLLESVLRAADRGVHVRLLIDDYNSFGQPQMRATLAALDKNRNIEVRLFNPFVYHGDVGLIRKIEFAMTAPRVNHRMHNKLMIVDGAVAVIGGRNVADGYFETGDLAIRFGDFDVAAVGPVVPKLAESFDAYWNCALAIPEEAIAPIIDKMSLFEAREVLGDNRARADQDGVSGRVDGGEPLAGLLRGTIPLSWAKAIVVADPPEKAAASSNGAAVSPTARELRERMNDVRREVVIISPYFIPGPAGLATLEELRKRGARVRILTNSLASTDHPVVHSAYRRYRGPLLDSGAEIFEVRPAPGAPRPDEEFRSGASGASGAPFALHAKAYVFDRQLVFLGSANLDPRSLELNTEVGLLIESPDLARQIIARFDEFSASSNSYHVTRSTQAAPGPALTWHTSVDGRTIEWHYEPDTTVWQRMEVEFLSLLPIEDQL